MKTEMFLASTGVVFGRWRAFYAWKLKDGSAAYTIFRGGKLWGNASNKWAIERHMLAGKEVMKKTGLPEGQYWHINNPIKAGEFPGALDHLAQLLMLYALRLNAPTNKAQGVHKHASRVG